MGLFGKKDEEFKDKAAEAPQGEKDELGEPQGEPSVESYEKRIQELEQALAGERLVIEQMKVLYKETFNGKVEARSSEEEKENAMADYMNKIKERIS